MITEIVSFFVTKDSVIKSEAIMSSIHSVIVHPIVLLGITDHVQRMSKMTKGRVVGVLLGSCRSGVVDCTTSFARLSFCSLLTFSSL